MKRQLIIFDFWKTLAYTPETNPAKLFTALSAFDINITNPKDAESLSYAFSHLMRFSKNWQDFSQQLLREFSEKQTKENVLKLAEFLEKNMSYKIYDDAKSIFSLPYKKAVLTDSSRFIVENSELKNFLQIFTPAETKTLKPAPAAFLAVLYAFDVTPKETVMVGDSIERDIEPARSLKIATVLVDRENQFPDYQDARINSLFELEKILTGL